MATTVVRAPVVAKCRLEHMRKFGEKTMRRYRLMIGLAFSYT